MSPWFVATMAAVAFYCSKTSPRYQRTFAVLAGFLAANAFIMLGLANGWSFR